MNKKLVLAIIISIVLIMVAILLRAVWVKGREALSPKSTVQIGDVIFNVDVASSPFSRTIGLAGRSSLAEDKGMLFLFERRLVTPFWMKGMRFPLDIIWIDGDEIVDINENVPIEEDIIEAELKQYLSSELMDKVLEVNAGLVEKFGIKIGDKVIIDIK
jgi:hypothetical protein